MSHLNLNLHTPNDFTKCLVIHYIYVKKFEILSRKVVGDQQVKCDLKKF